ncbi:MAG: bifunctional nuclease family protein [Bacteroidales bacterium]|nr:bifunctional nuclease family protein [Bacteroidales bacterium]
MKYYEVYPYQILRGHSGTGMSVLSLYEPTTHQNVPILIGPHEADMITLEQEGVQARRPMTHELICTIFRECSLELKDATIDRLEDGIFFATLYIDDGLSVRKVDARASDVIILAMRMNVPIRLSQAILDEAGYPSDVETIVDMDTEEPQYSLEELQQMLHEAEEAEEYERASEIMEKIKQLNKE